MKGPIKLKVTLIQGLRCGGSSNKTVEDAYICDGYNDCKSEVDEFLCYYSHQV